MTTDNVYVVLFHDVWDTGEDPGEENEYGLPEDTSIEGIYACRADAEAAIEAIERQFPSSARSFHTVEEHLLTPRLLAQPTDDDEGNSIMAEYVQEGIYG